MAEEAASSSLTAVTETCEHAQSKSTMRAMGE